MFVIERHDVKAAFVDIEVNVSLLKVRRAGLPDFCFRIQRLDRPPRSESDALAVLTRRNKENLQVIVAGLLVPFQDRAPPTFRSPSIIRYASLPGSSIQHSIV